MKREGESLGRFAWGEEMVVFGEVKYLDGVFGTCVGLGLRVPVAR